MNADADLARVVLFVALGAVVSSTGGAVAAPSLRAPMTPIQGIQSFATLDVDLDGDTDVVTVGWTGMFDAWSNDGAGVLTQTQSVALSESAFDVVVADVNQDGRFDAVVSLATTVQVMINQPAGFTLGVNLPVGGESPGRLAAADFDQDADVDVIVGTRSTGGGAFYILIGDGAGGFAPAVPYWPGWGGGPANVKIGDMNADGGMDAMWLGHGVRFHWTLGNGSGGFAFHGWHNPMPSTNMTGLAIGDVDADGRDDAVVSERIVSNLASYLRTYRSVAPFDFVPVAWSFIPASSSDVVLAELTGDGYLDAVTGASYVLEGSGTGAFETRAPTPFQANRLALADMNGDTRLDLVGTTPWGVSPDQLSLGLSDDSGIASRFGGTVVPLTEYPDTMRAMIAFDVDGDQDDDLVTAGGTSIVVFRSDAGGAFTPGPTSTAVVEAHQLLHGDFDGDGIQDIVFARDANELGFSRGDGDGGFVSPKRFFSLLGAKRKMLSIAAADVDGDQNLDVLAHSIDDSSVAPVISSIRIFKGNGAGGFQLVTQVSAGYSVLARNALAARDVNGDLLPDLLLGNIPETVPYQSLSNLQGRLTVWTGTGGFGFGPPTHYTAGPDPSSIVFADFDQDSRIDVALGNALGHHLDSPVPATVLFGAAGGGFGSPVPVGADFGGYRLAAGDFDGDGLIDLAAVDISQTGGILLASDGSGSFDRFGFVTPQSPDQLVAADFDGDGRLDLATHGKWVGIVVIDARPPAPSSCAGATATYGAGCPGSTGFVPTLSAYGCPSPGETVELELLGVPSTSLTFFLLSVATANLPMGYGCSLLVAPPLVTAPVAKAAGVTDVAVVHVPIPVGTPSVTVHLQSFVTNVAVPAGFANSNGVTLTIP